MARYISSLLGKLTMTIPTEATKLVLAQRPTGHVDDSTFRIEKVPMSSLTPSKPTDVLVRVDYVSLDPAMRGWLNDSRSYIPPVQIGETMRAGAIGTVVKVHSTDGKFKVGDVVKGVFGASPFLLYFDKQNLNPFALARMDGLSFDGREPDSSDQVSWHFYQRITYTHFSAPLAHHQVQPPWITSASSGSRVSIRQQVILNARIHSLKSTAFTAYFVRSAHVHRSHSLTSSF